MRLLFSLDKADYAGCTHTFERHSARAIILSGGKVLMIHSLKNSYYKFPGGGIEKGETRVDAMIRETREEAGLIVVRDSVREYGYVHRINRSMMDETECFIQDNYYYLCQVTGDKVPPVLEGYERNEQFVTEYVSPMTAIAANRACISTPYHRIMLNRETRVLEMLISEGYFGTAVQA